MAGEKLLRLGLAPLTAVNTLAHLAGLHVRPVALPCLFTLIFHHHCLGCGMTRAFDLLWTGHFRQALAMNRLAPIVFILLWWIFYLQLAELRGHMGLPFRRNLLKSGSSGDGATTICT
jgi:Protein of unknown function (DUF2752)